MRLNWGAVPRSPDFVPGETWKPLKEPSPWLAQLYAFPIAVTTSLILAVAWLLVIPWQTFDRLAWWPGILLSCACLVVAHELVHAAASPSSGRSDHSVLGFWPSRLVFYAHYDGELTRSRFIVILLMPLVVISFLPLLVSAITGFSSVWVAFVSTFNGTLACVDVLNVGILILQVPRSASVRNQGWYTFWRMPQAAGPAEAQEQSRSVPRPTPSTHDDYSHTTRT